MDRTEIESRNRLALLLTKDRIGNFETETETGTEAEDVTEIDCSVFPTIPFLVLSWSFPGHFQVLSWSFPGHFLVLSWSFPGPFPGPFLVLS